MYIVISLIVLVISAILFKKTSGTLSLQRLNLSSLVFYMMFFLAFIGSIEILYGLIPEEYVSNDQNLLLHGWMGVMYMMIALPIGMIIAQEVFNVKQMSVLISKFRSASIDINKSNLDISIRYSLLFFSLVTAGAVIWNIISQGESIPLLHLFMGSDDYSYMMQLRRSAGRIEGSKLLEGFISLQAGFAGLLAFCAYSFWRAERNKKHLYWLIAMCTIVVISLIYNMTKAPLITFLIGMLLLHTIIYGRISRRVLSVAGFLFIALIGLLFIFFQGTLVGSDINLSAGVIITQGIEAFLHRILFGQIMCFFMCMDIFPSSEPFMGLSSTGRLIHEFLGLPFSPDYGIVVMSVFRPELAESGVAGHATTVFIGEAWANFGLWGLLIAPLWVGFFIQSFHIYFLRRRKTPFNLAIQTQFALLMPITYELKGFYYPMWVIEYIAQIIIVYIVAKLFMRMKENISMPMRDA